MRRPGVAPLHPIVTHFTIALTASSLAFDGLGLVLDVPSLSAAGWWSLIAALPLTVGTLLTGVTSRMHLSMGEGEARRWLRAHMALGPAFFGALVVIALWRAALWSEGARVTWTYLATLGGLVAIMTVQGYLGGELVYRFGAEVKGEYPRLAGEREAGAVPPRAPSTAEREPA